MAWVNQASTLNGNMTKLKHGFSLPTSMQYIHLKKTSVEVRFVAQTWPLRLHGLIVLIEA
jgi:hypothetical protein